MVCLLPVFDLFLSLANGALLEEYTTVQKLLAQERRMMDDMERKSGALSSLFGHSRTWKEQRKRVAFFEKELSKYAQEIAHRCTLSCSRCKLDLMVSSVASRTEHEDGSTPPSPLASPKVLFWFFWIGCGVYRS